MNAVFTKAKKRLRRLFDLDVSEVSSVDHPANQRRFLVVKSKAEKRKHTHKLVNLKITRIATVDVPDNPGSAIRMVKRKPSVAKALAILEANNDKYELGDEMSLSSFEKRVQAITRDAIARYPHGRATISGALRTAGFPTAVLPSATEVSKSAGDPTYTRGDVESLMAAVDDPTFTGVNKYLYAVRENALVDPKPAPEVEVRKAWSQHTMQERAELALETLAAERFAKIRYLPDAPSKAQCYLSACESELGKVLYRAMTTRGNITAEEWLASQTGPSPSGEIHEVAKLLRSQF